MSLMFTQNRDQALLAYVIKVAADVAEKKKCWVGRTAVQKLMYFLVVRGVDTNYKFDIYQYGPFCEQILWDIDLLLADGVIQDKSSNPEKFSNYTPGQAIDELIQLYSGDLNNHEDVVQELAEAFVPLKPLELELIATLDYIYREQIATGAVENLKDKVVSRFQDIKKDKFSSSVVNQTYDAMVNANLVRA